METAEPRTFRATREAWLGQFLLPLVFFVLLTITAINATGLDPWIGGVGVGVVLVTALLHYVLPMLRNWLQLDARSLEGCLNGRYFQIYWGEVVAAWVVGRGRQRFLCVGTREGTLIIPLRFFDDCAIWEQVSAAVPPSALEPEAIQRLPDYRSWQEEQNQANHDGGRRAAAEHEGNRRDGSGQEATFHGAGSTAFETPTQRPVTDHWLLQVIGWSGLTFFVFGAVEAGQENHLPQLVIFVVLAGISALLLLSWGITELGVESIERYTLFGGWAINWKDVRWIEVDPSDSVMVLVGEDCQLVIPGPGVWNGGAGKKAAMANLLGQIERRRIPIRRTSAALLKTSRNTRIKK